MAAAMDLASVDGLHALSIGGLASAVSMSKGGIVALFGTKEQLQLATIEAATVVFRSTVIAPALSLKNRARLLALVDNWIEYSRNRVFLGGCFFMAVRAEFASEPGAVREAITAQLDSWDGFLRRSIDHAVAAGELPIDSDSDQLVFELTAMLSAANAASLLHGGSGPYQRARTAISRVLGAG
ncbi:TetR/AcrR family transcriptional regulator [soil metagenome]